ncbi:flagellar hook-basal body protein [Entomospira culicis]|uniref:Flagellar hook-basal body protein n=1 Tax=Entomospira culicis TaxID=2719989 RepID=A0A968GEQ5_9SPIO|nr:flagellar hook-basal body protein [Entomospira culicis]NIZ18467.1 flagellar hook-basal body protein [Entomospira culicis]NIZ68683.1 flagellar hook-basal body protein [Entomospira culicis]WDI37282.1 flagellar hook-basal body protein [Entomospira culicis]WDI38911.1 flagellar hook-basal body protein [Entomospira culicis]
MVRGLYIGASGMQANEHRLDVVANNLANVDLTGYKKDVSILKAFPELLIQRVNDNGRVTLPIGSYDSAPIVGKLGMGVEYNETYTLFEQGSFKQTENAFDLALGNNEDTLAMGFFVIETPYGERYTRNGSFMLGKEGYLETKDGYRVLGENGPIQVKLHNFKVDKDGTILHNSAIDGDPRAVITARENDWAQSEVVDRLRIVHFFDTMDQPAERYLNKVGNSMWQATELSGEARDLQVGERRPQVLQGFLETSSVNAVQEMVTMITVNRAYEASQKSVQTADTAIEQAINKVLRA